MRKFKKISSLLSVLLILAISVGTFPLSALAQYYTINDDSGRITYIYNGEIQAPNSSVLSGLGAESIGTLPFNKNFPTPPSFSSRANNNWSTSLSSKTFSIIGSDNVGDPCNVSMFSNSSLGLNVSPYNDSSDGGNLFLNYFCSPTVSVATTRNANSNASGRPVAVQTSEVLPLAVFEEDTLVTRVESIQNKPNKVMVTVAVDSTVEAYGARFQRVDGVSDWVGHVIRDPETNRYSLLDAEKANDAQLPQGVKIGANSPSESRSVERPRNSDVIEPSVTQPKCTQWSDGNFWRTVQHVHCVKYALSADGRTGEAHYYDSQSSGTFFQALVTIGVGFAVGYFIGPGLIDAISSVTTIAGETLTIGSNILSGVSSVATLSGVVDATVAAASGSSVVGTVESTVASSPPYGTEKAWVWTWSELPAQPTVCPTGQIGTPPACTCANGLNISTYPTCVATSCPAGTTGVYPNCTTTPTVLGTVSKPVTVTVCSGNTPTWNVSSCVGTSPVVPPVTPPVTPVIPAVVNPVAPVIPVTTVNSSNNGSQNSQNSQGGQNQGGQNQGNPSVVISADPNRVRSGDTATISWTLNNVNNCAITKNGTTWKSDISSSGESTPPEIITAQTTYTITCPSTSPESVTVNILPVFQEF